MIQRSVTVGVVITPRELAVEFCNMDAESQARFFADIERVVDENWGRPFCFQLSEIIKEARKLPAAMRVLSEIAGYIETD